jgi:hypothetical protein
LKCHEADYLNQEDATDCQEGNKSELNYAFGISNKRRYDNNQDNQHVS